MQNTLRHHEPIRVMEGAHNNLFRIKLSSQKVPQFKEQSGKDWILYGTEAPWRNIFPDYLIDLYCRNSKHAAIINGKVHYICGNGWEVEAGAGITVGQQTATALSLLNANDIESWDELTRKIVLDFELFDGFALEVIWSNGGTPYFYHVPFNRVRANKDHSEFYYCTDWTKSDPADKEELGWKTWKPFDKNKKGAPSLIYFFMRKPTLSGNIGVYPYPNYIQCAASIETGVEIANFHLNRIKNNFWGSFWITIMNTPAAKERDEVERKIKDKFSGSDNAGEIVLEFANSEEKAAKFQSLDQPDLHAMFIELRKDVDQDLITGHQVPSGILFGIKTEGGLGERTEKLVAYEEFKNTYVNARQRIIECEFNKIFSWQGHPKIRLRPVEPITEKFSEAVVAKVMTVDEIREKAGLPKLKDGQQIEEMVNEETVMGECVSHFIMEGKTHEQALSICHYNPKAHLKKAVMSSQVDDKACLEELKKCGAAKSSFSIIASEPISTYEFSFNEESESRLIVSQKMDELRDAPSLKVGSDGTVKGPGGIVRTDIKVMYSYEVREGYGAEIIDTTREFCREMIALDRFYTRADIERISSVVGYNVWEHTGGYYHKPGGKTYDHCRHEWRRHIVKVNG